MPHKPLCSLVVCGNKEQNGKFTAKVEWLQKALSPLTFVQVDTNQFIYKCENMSFNLFLIQGEQDSIKLCRRICDKRDFIVVNGACCSIDKSLCVGSIFLPNFAINVEGHRTAFSPFLLRYARNLTEKCYGTYSAGGILQAKDNIINLLDIKWYRRSLSNICIDQETAIMGTMCAETKSKLCAVLYISDNLPLKQNLETVNLDTILFQKKILAKRKSLLIAVRIIMECAKKYESI